MSPSVSIGISGSNGLGSGPWEHVPCIELTPSQKPSSSVSTSSEDVPAIASMVSDIPSLSSSRSEVISVNEAISSGTQSGVPSRSKSDSIAISISMLRMTPVEFTAETEYVVKGVTCNGTPEIVPSTEDISRPKGSWGCTDQETAELLVAFLTTQRSLPEPSFASK